MAISGRVMSGTGAECRAGRGRGAGTEPKFFNHLRRSGQWRRATLVFFQPQQLHEQCHLFCSGDTLCSEEGDGVLVLGNPVQAWECNTNWQNACTRDTSWDGYVGVRKGPCRQAGFRAPGGKARCMTIPGQLATTWPGPFTLPNNI
jgi:hypothetical protein